MTPLITIFGSKIPTSDFWAGMIVFGTIGGICLAGWISRARNNDAVDRITGIVWCGVLISAGAVVYVGLK